MKILIGKNAGFCYGVKRAVEGAEDVLSKNNNKAFCLGELVHNKEVIKDLESKGITFIEELEADLSNVIIRAHGIPKNIYEYMEINNINYFDYTCPNVLNIHKIASEYAQNGYFIFLLGDSKHPENLGTISFCGKNSLILENKEEVLEAIKKFQKSKLKKLVVIEQTTFSVKHFEDIVNSIKNLIGKDSELVIKNTICNATEIRQKETEELSKKVQYMIIIGGKNSSNTKKLYDIAANNCKNTICIENKNELNVEEVKKFDVIGIMAGASTPQSSIDDVKNILEN